MKPKKTDKIKEKVYNTVMELYNKIFKNYYHEKNKLSDVRKNKHNEKFNPKNLILKDYNYDMPIII